MFEGDMVDMIYETNPAFHDIVILNNDSKKIFLYGQLIKVVYGTLLGVIILYNKLSRHLTDHEFKWNEYDMYIFNKMVNSEQITVQSKVAKDSPRPPPEDTNIFHCHVARLLFENKRARPDKSICVAFL